MSSSSAAPQPPFVAETNKPAVQLSSTQVVIIQSEDFHRASDSDLANTGPCSAPAGPVDYYPKQPNAPGTCDIGNTQVDEWLEYKVRTDKASVYDVAIRLATGNQGARSVGLWVNGQELGSVSVPLKGENNFEDQVIQSVALKQGENTLRIYMITGGVRFDAVKLTPLPGTVDGIDTRVIDAVNVPARIESEDYIRAFDTEVANTGPCDARGPVDYYNIQPDAEGKCDIGNTDIDEWLEYKIAVAKAGEYDIDFNFATGNDGTREVEFFLNGTKLGKKTVPRNGADTFGPLSFDKVMLPEGESTIRVFMVTGGVRFDSIDISEPTNEIDGPIVTGFQIINVVTDQALNGYENIAPGSSVTLDLDKIGNNDLVLRALTTGGTQSVKFGLNNRVNYLLDDAAPFALYQDRNGDYRKWTLFPGVHDVAATPYPTKSGDTNPGRAVSVQLTLKQAEWTVDERSVDYIARINNSATNAIVVKNIGNNGGSVTLKNIPNWLTFTRTQAQIAPAGEAQFQATSLQCGQQLTRRATINVEASNGKIIPVEVRQACSNTAFDMAVDRVVINQAVPSFDTYAEAKEQIPLVRNRAGLLRVFVTANQTNSHNVKVKVFYRRGNNAPTSIDLTQVQGVPLIVNEGLLAQTYNFEMPKDFFEPTTEFYIELDSNNQIAEANEDNNRYPLSGYAKLDIQDVPSLNITFVPVIIDGRNPNLSNSVLDDLMKDTVKLHPIENYNIEIRQAYTYTGNEQGVRSWSHALSKIAELKRLDNSNRYYHGLTEISVDNGRTAGIAYLGSQAALSRKSPGTIAHEFGHNFSLSHTDCGSPLRPENQYPHPNALTNIWGYDILNRVLTPPSSRDLMSYCNNEWASKFGYNKVMNYRGVQGSSNRKESFSPEATEVAWISGVVKLENGLPTLNVTNTFEALGQLTSEPGVYTLTAFNDSDIMIYFATFDVKEVDHAEESHFMVAMPKEDVARIEIARDNNLMLAMPWGMTTVGAQKEKAPMILERIDAESIRLRWASAPLTSITVRDANTGVVLTNDQSGDAIIYTSSDQLELTENGPGYSRTQTLNVTTP